MKDRAKAVALRYLRQKDAAPRVVAKGQGWLAERILQLARDSNVPIHRDSDLVEVLIKLDVGETIPAELYKVVAEVLAYIYLVNKRAM